MSIKAIVFDFDGVLADSEMIHFRVYNELLAS
jgi:beta-phosphoglucomutase-like phosphatase (HAD superfamily)